MSESNQVAKLTDEQKAVINRRNVESALYDYDQQKPGFSEWLAAFKRCVTGMPDYDFYSIGMIDFWFEIYETGMVTNEDQYWSLHEEHVDYEEYAA